MSYSKHSSDLPARPATAHEVRHFVKKMSISLGLGRKSESMADPTTEMLELIENAVTQLARTSSNWQLTQTGRVSDTRNFTINEWGHQSEED